MWKRILFASLAVAILLALVLGHWRGRSFLFSTALGLPHARNDVSIEADVTVTMADGTGLATDIYRPVGLDTAPAILMRTAYGKAAPSTKPFAMAFARRGYIVVAQDVRGTGNSDGSFVPLVNERSDGADTVSWLSRQPWFDGQLGLFGLSYLGFTANAIAVDNPPQVKAVFAPVTTRSFYPVYYETGGFNLDAALGWAVIVHRQETAGQEGPSLLRRILSRGENTPAIPYDALPIAEADVAATGEKVEFYRTFVTQTDPGADYWRQSSLTENDIAGITAPVYLASGWYDALLPHVLSDYATLEKAGRAPRLVIGDGPHVDTMAIFRYFKHSIAWFDHHLQGRPMDLPPEPVQIRRMGDNKWLHLEEWPVSSPRTSFYFGPDEKLTTEPVPLDSSSTHYTYDPANPTPAIGGPLLSTTKPVVDNAELESRADTITFTTTALDEDVDILGTPSALLHVQANAETIDLFVRIARVDKNGKSTNVTDGVRRFSLTKTGGPIHSARVDLWPTAIRLRAGERLRVMIASGAHPRIARNLGEGDLAEQASMTTMRSAVVTIHHNREHPSLIELPFRVSTSDND